MEMAGYFLEKKAYTGYKMFHFNYKIYLANQTFSLFFLEKPLYKD